MNTYNTAHLQGKKLLITGGTGFVGSHLLHALENSGAHITCLIRPSSRRDALPQSVRPLIADLSTGYGLNDALADQDIVIHMAGSLFNLHWQDYFTANIRTAQIFGEAIAKHKNIQRVLYVSSLAATGPCATSPGARHSDIPAPVSAYGWSKYVSEQVLGRTLGTLAEKLVVLRPPIIYGSKDKGLLPYFKSARMGFIITPGMGRVFPVSAIHVHDIVRAILCTLTPEAHGIYHCNDGTEHTMQEIGLLIAKLQERKARILTLPLPLMHITALLSTWGGTLLHTLGCKYSPIWNIDKYKEAKEEGWLCAGKRLQEELHFVPQVALQQGLEEAIAGYKKDGWL